MTVKKCVIDSKTGETLGYICETDERGSFFVQNKRVVVGACVDQGVNNRHMNIDRMMRDNRAKGM